MKVSYYLPALETTVGEDDGSLQSSWTRFVADHPEVVAHRCNGVTRWRTEEQQVQRITYAVEGLNNFRFEDKVVDLTPDS